MIFRHGHHFVLVEGGEDGRHGPFWMSEAKHLPIFGEGRWLLTATIFVLAFKVSNRSGTQANHSSGSVPEVNSSCLQVSGQRLRMAVPRFVSKVMIYDLFAQRISFSWSLAPPSLRERQWKPQN